MASASSRTYRGVERNQEIEPAGRRDDVRSTWRRTSDKLDTPDGALLAFLGLAALVCTLGLLLPGAGEVGMALALATYGAKYSFGKRRWDAPYRVPAHLAHTARIRFLDGSTGKPGDGLIYHGREINTGRQLWSSAGDIRTHRLVLGTTGSGKTEELLGAIFNALVLDSGAMLVDGKSDPKTVDGLLRVCRVLGRDEDLLLLNYIMGGRDFASGLDSRRSHTYNPLSSGSAAMKSELMVSLLDTGQGGGSDMWQGRAINFMEAITPPLSFLADKGFVLFNPKLLCDFYLINNIENLLWFGILIDLNGKVVNLKEGSDDYRRIYNDLYEKYSGNLRLYMENLPGYAIPKQPHRPTHMEASDWAEVLAKPDPPPSDELAKEGEQADKKKSAQSAEKAREKVLEQHGYITMQLVRATGNLTFNYGHIYNDEIGEINYRDILLNRRVLLVMLPALERSKASMEQLGKMAVASIKGVLATLLDTPLEGSRREIIEGRPSNAPIPYEIICDEYGYYVVPGFAVAPAQARSYGVSMTFGAQDYPSLVRANKEEGEATWENTNLRHCGRMTGGEESETFKRIAGAGGYAVVSTAQGMEYSRTAVDRFRVSDQTTLEKVHRINSDDLAQQQDGEFHLIVGSKSDGGRGGKTGGARVVRYLAFYTGDVPTITQMRLVHYVQVKKFSDAERDDIARNEAVAQHLGGATSDQVRASVDPVLRAAIREAREAAGQVLAPGDACEDLVDKFLFYARAMDWQVSPAQMRRWLDSYDAGVRKEIAERAARRAADAGASAVLRAAEAVARGASADPRLAKRHADLVAAIIAAWKAANADDPSEEDATRQTAVAARGKANRARPALMH